MNARTLLRTAAATVALAAAGTAAVTAPALAGSTDGPASTGLVRYAGFPADATAVVTTTLTPAGRSMVTLDVAGLEPGRTYGAHAHVNRCGATGGAAGPHWQRRPGPATPAYANPGNEVWLDVTVGADGTGSSSATQDFAFSSTSRPLSVIIHALPTGTGKDDAGVAGPRLACVDVAF